MLTADTVHEMPEETSGSGEKQAQRQVWFLTNINFTWVYSKKRGSTPNLHVNYAINTATYMK